MTHCVKLRLMHFALTGVAATLEPEICQKTEQGYGTGDDCSPIPASDGSQNPCATSGKSGIGSTGGSRGIGNFVHYILKFHVNP